MVNGSMLMERDVVRGGRDKTYLMSDGGGAWGCDGEGEEGWMVFPRSYSLRNGVGGGVAGSVAGGLDVGIGAITLVCMGKVALEEGAEGWDVGLSGRGVGNEVIYEACDGFDVEDMLGKFFGMIVAVDSEVLVGAVCVKMVEIAVGMVG